VIAREINDNDVLAVCEGGRATNESSSATRDVSCTGNRKTQQLFHALSRFRVAESSPAPRDAGAAQQAVAKKVLVSLVPARNSNAMFDVSSPHRELAVAASL